MGESLQHPVVDTVSRAPVTVEADATLRRAAHELWIESVGAAIALRGDRPVGIISERDVVAALAGGADPDACTVAEAMTPQILEAKPNDRVLTAVLDMIDHGIRHLPVFDEAGRCQAIVSMRDLLRPMLIDALEVERIGHDPDEARGARPPG
jgi:CBS domain-containing protein